MTPRILYEDNHLLAVLKPPGLLSQADAGGRPDLLNLCKEYIKTKYEKPGEVYLGLVHRLDLAVGGPMIFARTSKAARRLAEQFRNRQTNKIYHAAVEGVWEEQEGELRDYTRKDARRRLALPAAAGEDGAREAALEYRLLARARVEKRRFNNLFIPEHGDGDWTSHPEQKKIEISLLEIRLLTGRFHQIRFQLSKRGHPLLGDVKYRSGCKLREGRIALEEVSLSFLHPVKKTPLVLEGPRRLQEVFAALTETDS